FPTWKIRLIASLHRKRDDVCQHCTLPVYPRRGKLFVRQARSAGADHLVELSRLPRPLVMAAESLRRAGQQDRAFRLTKSSGNVRQPKQARAYTRSPTGGLMNS